MCPGDVHWVTSATRIPSPGASGGAVAASCLPCVWFAPVLLGATSSLQLCAHCGRGARPVAPRRCPLERTRGAATAWLARPGLSVHTHPGHLCAGRAEQGQAPVTWRFSPRRGGAPEAQGRDQLGDAPAGAGPGAAAADGAGAEGPGSAEGQVRGSRAPHCPLSPSLPVRPPRAASTPSRAIPPHAVTAGFARHGGPPHPRRVPPQLLEGMRWALPWGDAVPTRGLLSHPPLCLHELGHRLTVLPVRRGSFQEGICGF